MFLNYTNDRLKNLIKIVEDIRDYELAYNYYMDMTDIINILEVLIEKDDGEEDGTR